MKQNKLQINQINQLKIPNEANKLLGPKQRVKSRSKTFCRYGEFLANQGPCGTPTGFFCFNRLLMILHKNSKEKYIISTNEINDAPTARLSHPPIFAEMKEIMTFYAYEEQRNIIQKSVNVAVEMCNRPKYSIFFMPQFQ